MDKKVIPMKLFRSTTVFKDRQSIIRVNMAKFWITIALLFSLIAQSAMVNAMPSAAANDQHSSHRVQMMGGKISCTIPGCPSTDCLQLCQDSLTSHCKTHCLAQLYLEPSHLQLVLATLASKRIAIQSWAIQTVDLGLTTPPPNSSNLR
jgi:hypothetical protein